MTTRTEQSITRVQALEDELAAKEEVRDAAIAAVQEAAELAEELERQLTNTTEIKEYRRLEAERDEARRVFAVARASREEASLAVDETKKALSEARLQAHRERYRELSVEAEELVAKRDELAAELNAVLAEGSRLRSNMAGELTYFDQDAANSMAVGELDANGYWLRDTFRRWLS